MRVGVCREGATHGNTSLVLYTRRYFLFVGNIENTLLRMVGACAKNIEKKTMKRPIIQDFQRHQLSKKSFGLLAFAGRLLRSFN